MRFLSISESPFQLLTDDLYPSFLLPRSFCQQPNLKLSVSCRPQIYYMTTFLTDLNVAYNLNARSGEFLDIDLIDTLLAYNT